MGKPVTHWMLEPLRKYATFGGRAPRAEYWWFWLFSVGLISAAAFIDVIALGGNLMNSMGNLGLFSSLAALGVALPSLAVQVRRLHDLDKSGWFILIGLIPVIGGLIIFWFNIQRGTQGPNTYGEDPLDSPRFFT